MKLSILVQPSKCKAITSLFIGKLNCMHRAVREACAEFQYATRRFLDRQIELQKDLP